MTPCRKYQHFEGNRCLYHHDICQSSGSF